MIEFLEVSMKADHRWLAGTDVAVRCAFFRRKRQQFRDIHEDDSSMRWKKERCRVAECSGSMMPHRSGKARTSSEADACAVASCGFARGVRARERFSQLARTRQALARSGSGYVQN